MPTGRPDLVIPAGKLMPGMPPTLPGLVLRMKVGKVGTACAVEHEGLVFADLDGGRRRGRKDDGGDAVFAEMTAIGVLQHRMQRQRFPICVLREWRRRR